MRTRQNIFIAGGLLSLVYLSSFLLVDAFPIEVKDIQFLFPPQSTFLDANGEYLTNIDKQIGEDETEKKAEKACIPKQQSEPNSADDSIPGFLTSDSDPNGEVKNDFNDETPLNGTIVDDPMEVKIYKPECDD